MARRSGGWLAGLCMAAAAQAQVPGEPGGGEPPQLETVTVTGRRSIEQRFFSAGSLVVIDRRDIENLGAFSVADVLRQLPGVVVTTSGDGSVEIRMRGMDRNSTQILVDGQRTANGRSQLALDQLPSEMIERIEVLRAPSAEHSGATGGTINLVLRQATTKRETVVRATDNRVWGRNGPQAFFSNTGPLARQPAKPVPGQADLDAAQPWSYFFALASTTTLLGADTERNTIELGTRTHTHATTRYRRHELSLIPRLNGKLGPSDQLALRGTFLRTTSDGRYDATGTRTTGAGSSDFLSGENSQFERHYLQGGADWTHRFAGSKLESTVNASRAREGVVRAGGTTSVQGTFPASSYTFDDQREEKLASVSAKLTGTQSPLLWMTGAQLERRELSIANTSNGVPSELGAVLDRYILWGQNEWEVLHGSTLTGGLRGEMLSTRSTSTSVVLADRRSGFVQPSLHLRTPVNEDLQFRANIARITRQPRIWDLVDRRIVSQGTNSLANPDYVGNPGLRPETSWTLDTGLERRLAQDGQAGLNLLVRRTSDTFGVVAALAGGRWTEQRVNLGDALVWGLEADVKSGLTWAGLGSDWTLSANASVLQSRMESGPTQGERIPGQPRYTASVTVAKPIRRSGGWFGGGTLSLSGASDLNTAPGLTGHGRARTTLDVYAGYLVRGWGYWRVGVYNLFDAPQEWERHYTDAAGAAASSSTRQLLTPRVYLTVGTQF